MNDIVERLTASTVLETFENGSQLTREAHPLGKEAAAEIIRLRAENDKLRAALKQIAATYNNPKVNKDSLAFIAAAALKETGMSDDLKGHLSDAEWLSFLQYHSVDKVKAAHAEIEKLRAALKPFAEQYDAVEKEFGLLMLPDDANSIVRYADLRAAAAALKETGDE